MAVQFHCEEVDFPVKNFQSIEEWVSQCVSSESYVLSAINVVFCTDEYLLSINIKHLNHNYFTDIITFNYNEKNQLSGDLFISVERVRENAQKLKLNFIDELHRVIIHGILHLCGYKDGTDTEQLEIRAKEDFYLNLRPQNLKRST